MTVTVTDVGRTIAAAVSEAESGARVLWVAERSSYAQAVLEDALKVAPARPDVDLVDVCRANGRQRINYPSGGWIRFVPSARAMRDYAVDFVFISESAPAEQYLNAALCLNASKHPEADIRIQDW